MFSVPQPGFHSPAEMALQAAPKEQIAMWQQNSYMTDSGIHSGATTQAPSLTGKDEDLDVSVEWAEGQGYGQSGYTSEQVCTADGHSEIITI